MIGWESAMQPEKNTKPQRDVDVSPKSVAESAVQARIKMYERINSAASKNVQASVTNTVTSRPVIQLAMTGASNGQGTGVPLRTGESVPRPQTKPAVPSRAAKLRSKLLSGDREVSSALRRARESLSVIPQSGLSTAAGLAILNDVNHAAMKPIKEWFDTAAGGQHQGQALNQFMNGHSSAVSAFIVLFRDVLGRDCESSPLWDEIKTELEDAQGEAAPRRLRERLAGDRNKVKGKEKIEEDEEATGKGKEKLKDEDEEQEEGGKARLELVDDPERLPPPPDWSIPVPVALSFDSNADVQVSYEGKTAVAAGGLRALLLIWTISSKLCSAASVTYSIACGSIGSLVEGQAGSCKFDTFDSSLDANFKGMRKYLQRARDEVAEFASTLQGIYETEYHKEAGKTGGTATVKKIESEIKKFRNTGHETLEWTNGIIVGKCAFNPESIDVKFNFTLEIEHETIKGSDSLAAAMGKSGECFYLKVGRFIILSPNKRFTHVGPTTQAALRIAALEGFRRGESFHALDLEEVSGKITKSRFRKKVSIEACANNFAIKSFVNDERFKGYSVEEA